MPTHGGYSPQPERYGGGAPKEQVIAEALDRGLGSAHDTGDESPQHVESVAFARAIADVWETNQRMANQVIPSRMTTLLSRWEAILGAFPLTTETDVDRRARVSRRFERITTDVTFSRVESTLQELLGDVFVSVNHIDPSEAVTFWPGGSTDLDWYSTVYHLPIQTQKPAGYSEADFIAAVETIFQELDEMLPAHITFCWYRNGAGHSGATWTGDDASGFFLDETNLDYEAFGS